jgi:hypothetical protein
MENGTEGLIRKGKGEDEEKVQLTTLFQLQRLYVRA